MTNKNDDKHEPHAKRIIEKPFNDKQIDQLGEIPGIRDLTEEESNSVAGGTTFVTTTTTTTTTTKKKHRD